MMKKQGIGLMIGIVALVALVALPRGIGIQTIVRIVSDDTPLDPPNYGTNGTSGINNRFTSYNLIKQILIRNVLIRHFLLDIFSVLEKKNLSGSFLARLPYIIY
jgi:hypothetical protein